MPLGFSLCLCHSGLRSQDVTQGCSSPGTPHRAGHRAEQCLLLRRGQCDTSELLLSPSPARRCPLFTHPGLWEGPRGAIPSPHVGSQCPIPLSSPTNHFPSSYALCAAGRWRCLPDLCRRIPCTMRGEKGFKGLFIAVAFACQPVYKQ